MRAGLEIAIRTLESQRGVLLRALAGAASEMNWRDAVEKDLLIKSAKDIGKQVREIDDTLKTLREALDGLAGGNPKLPASRDSAEEDSATSQERWDRVFENHGLLGGR